MYFKKCNSLIGIFIISLLLSGCAGLTEVKKTEVKKTHPSDFDIQKLEEEIKKSPDNPQKRIGLANAYLAKYSTKKDVTDLEKAIEESRKAVRLNPEYADAHAFLGMVLATKSSVIHDEKLFEEVVKEFKEANRIKPEGNYPPYQYISAQIYLDKSKKDKKFIDDAIRELKDAIQAKPEHAPSHTLLGRIYYQQEKKELALLELKEAARLNPEEPSTHKLLGYIYSKKIHSEESYNDEEAINQGIKEYKEVIRLKPEDDEAHRRVSFLYIHKELYDLSLFEAKEALRLSNSASNHAGLGYAYLHQDNYGQARKEYEESLKLKFDYGAARTLASTYFYQNRFEDSVNTFKKFKLTDLASESKTYAILHYYLALRHLEKQDEAEKLLEDYAKDFKGKEWESYLLQYYQRSLPESELIAKARYTGERCEAFYYIGCQYLIKGEKENARDYFQKAMDTKAFCYDEYTGSHAMLEQLMEK